MKCTSYDWHPHAKPGRLVKFQSAKMLEERIGIIRSFNGLGLTVFNGLDEWTVGRSAWVRYLCETCKSVLPAARMHLRHCAAHGTGDDLISAASDTPTRQPLGKRRRKNFQAKTCAACGTEFTPTSGVQKRCAACRGSKPKGATLNGLLPTCYTEQVYREDPVALDCHMENGPAITDQPTRCPNCEHLETQKERLLDRCHTLELELEPYRKEAESRAASDTRELELDKINTDDERVPLWLIELALHVATSGTGQRMEFSVDDTCTTVILDGTATIKGGE